MIVNDRNIASLVASGLVTIGLFLGGTPAIADPAQAAAVSPAAIAVSLVADGLASTYQTHAATVGQFLEERQVAVGPDDFLSAPRDTTLVDGMTLVYRSAVPAVLIDGGSRRIVRSSCDTVRDFIARQGVRLGRDDSVSPGLDAPLVAGAVVRITRVRTWTSIVREHIAYRTRERFDAHLRRGLTKTLAAGAPGLRETTLRFWSRDGGAPERTILASRVVREPQTRVLLRGIGSYAGLAAYAKAGFEGTLRFIGSAMQMIATAYTAACYGCSGTTAIGVRAGHGVVAVDPRMIPLGTKLFIPGYGRAVAGDTGGAIVGNRIDLGFDTASSAMQFGRRPVTVYVLK